MIKQFTKEYKFLSNFYPCIIPYKGYTYPSVEHAYQAQKSDDIAWKQRCTLDYAPDKIKQESYQQKLVDGWEEMKINLMLELLRIKYSHFLIQIYAISYWRCRDPRRQYTW
jgi:predicted NAD-dependent protein-ADP-ribosyltransferase YbiA (DUF1768 family)